MAVPFDPFHFERQATKGIVYSPEEVFRRIYETNHWSAESRSGAGAALDQAAVIVRHLPSLFTELGVRVLLDLPCGDLSWMRQVPLDGISYIGGDILPEIVQANQARWAGPARQFVRIDIARDRLPAADLILCRDCFVHLSNAEILEALRNITNGSIEYLLTTTFPECEENVDITTGDWRLINLQLPPFNFPAPERIINEQCTEGDGMFADKSLALWKTSNLRQA